MTENVIYIAGIALALISGALTLSKKSSETRKWSALAFIGVLAYMFASYPMSMISDTVAFAFTQEARLLTGSLSAGSFIMAIAAAGKAQIDKNVFNGFIGVSCIFTVAGLTMRLHDMGIAGVELTGPDSDGLYSYAFTRGMLYISVAAIFAAVLFVLAIYVIALVFRTAEKIPGTVKLGAVLSLLLPVVIALSVFDIIPSPIIVPIVIIAAAVLLLVIVMTSDKADIVDFGKISSVNNTSDGIVILDPRGKFLFANRKAKLLFIEFSENDPAKTAELVASLPENGTLERGGNTYEITRTMYADYSGKSDCIVIYIRDVTEQQLRTDRLAEEATTDSITGVSSRSVAITTLKEVCENDSGTLIIMSFDGFKSINNAYGHETANELLKTYGTLVKNNTNTDDIRGRFGGGKFIIFLKNCTSEGVIANLSMRLEEQSTTAAHKLLGDSLPISVGVSVGAVFVPDAGRNFDLLSEYADTERLRIKNSGGHGYSIYGSTAIERLGNHDSENEMLSFPDAGLESLTEAAPENDMFVPIENDSETPAADDDMFVPIENSAPSADDDMFVPIENSAPSADDDLLIPQ